MSTNKCEPIPIPNPKESKGSTIVMLKQHIEDEAQLSEEQKAKFFQEAAKVGKILKKFTKHKEPITLKKIMQNQFKQQA